MNESPKIIKRIAAYFLDILFIYVLISMICSIKFINPNYDKYEKTYNSYNNLLKQYYDEEISIKEMTKESEKYVYYLSKYGISNNIVIITVILLYFGLFQKYNKGQTLGKKIMKYKVVGMNNTEVGILNYFLRLLPMYFVFIGNVISVLLNIIYVSLLNQRMYGTFSSVTTYLIFGIGIITAVMTMRSKDNRGLHDIIAKTKVVVTEE